MIITYFVHSTTINNEAKIASGWENSKLSEKGLKQARELRDLVQTRFDIVWASDLDRAIETASIAFAPVCIKTDWRLREINYGKLNGTPSAIVKQDLTKYIQEPFPDGESYCDVAKRMLEFLQELKRDYSQKSVAIVGHQAPQFALDVLLKHKSWEQAFQEDWRHTHSWQPGWTYEVSL